MTDKARINTKDNSKDINNNKSINYLISKKIKEDSKEELEEELEEELTEDLEKELEKAIPKKFGNIWTDNERKVIIKMLKDYNSKTDNILKKKIISKIAKKLDRSEGGVRSEIKKIAFNKYIEGYRTDEIAKELNISSINVKLIIRMYIEKDSNNLINLLEKENKIFNLVIENIKLKKELRELKTK